MRDDALSVAGSELRSVAAYCVIAFAFSWVVWLSGVFKSAGLIDFAVDNMVVVGIGSFGPLVASFFLVLRREGAAGLIRFIKRAADFRFRKIWLVPAILAFPVLVGTAYLAYSLLRGTSGLPELPLLKQPWMIVPSFLAAFFLFGAVQEEFGWRGYALVRLQARWGALASSLLLGVIWALWHLPLFFIDGTGQSRTPFLWFFVGTVSVSVIYSWIFNRANNSIFVALLLHAMHNTAFNLFPLALLPNAADAFFFLAIVQCAAAVAIILLDSGHFKTKTENTRGNAI